MTSSTTSSRLTVTGSLPSPEPDRLRIGLFPTCLVDAVSVEVGVATTRLLRRLGHEVVLADDATCCGQPAWNSGYVEAAATVARGTIDALDRLDADVVVVPAGSCATMMRVFWRELFGVVDDPAYCARAERVGAKVRELAELLATVGSLPEATGAVAEPALHHRSCHMLRELRIVTQPEDVLDRAGVARVVSSAQDRCCGFGGLFSVKLPEASTAMADDVLDAAVASGARTVVGCDSSCLLHLRGRADRRGLDLEFRHLAEVLEGVSL
jgi:L-lactate dehydrogenase complex protein LldE